MNDGHAFFGTCVDGAFPPPEDYLIAELHRLRSERAAAGKPGPASVIYHAWPGGFIIMADDHAAKLSNSKVMRALNPNTKWTLKARIPKY